jgi:hypothetical protein
MDYVINFSSTLTTLGSKKNLLDIFQAIKYGEFEEQINEYRNQFSIDTRKANEVKKSLPCFTTSGYFETERRKESISHYNSLIHLDYDLKDSSKADEVMSKVIENPYTFAAFRSPTYGVKLFIRTNSSIESHLNYFNEIRKNFDTLLGVESDGAIKDITRLCFVSDDPDLYLNENSAVFNIESNEDDLMQTLWSFTENNKPYEEGNRNNFIHLYSCNASRWGIKEDITYSYLVNRCNDLNEHEIMTTINSAYRQTIGEFNSFGRGSNSSNGTIEFIQNNTLSDRTTLNYDFKSYDSPSINDDWYKLLPQPILEACQQFSGREKDIFLTGLLTTLSAAMHNVYGVYNGEKVNPNLLSFVVAPAASGKSSIKYSRDILKCYHEVIKASDSFNNKLFFLPANSSSSMLYELLETNGGIGLIFETEADTLSNALKQEWGDFSDVLRKDFHNEPISMARKQNNEYFEVENPRFGVCVTGTPEQVTKLIPSTENGLYSRFLFYSFSEEFVWNDALLTIEPTKQLYFEEFNSKICERLSNNQIREFRFTEEQSIKFNEVFKSLSEQLVIKYPNAVDQIKRAGLKVYKIAMTLSAFRSTSDEIVCADNDFNFALNSVTKVYLPHQINVSIMLYNKHKGLSGQDLMYAKLPHYFSREDIKATYDFPPSDRTITNYLEKLIESGKINRIAKGSYMKN